MIPRIRDVQDHILLDRGDWTSKTRQGFLAFAGPLQYHEDLFNKSIGDYLPISDSKLKFATRLLALRPMGGTTNATAALRFARLNLVPEGDPDLALVLISDGDFTGFDGLPDPGAQLALQAEIARLDAIPGVKVYFAAFPGATGDLPLGASPFPPPHCL